MRAEMTPWQSPPSSLQLSDHELHLWRFRLDMENEAGPDHLRILSPDELLRAGRLLDERKKSQFVQARMFLRSILGEYLHIRPDQVQFKYNAYGKPALAEQHRSSLFFNLSHSGEWGLLAVSKDAAVGVDVEKIDPDIRFSELAENYFNGPEKSALELYPTKRKRRGFYRLWTRKEALLKLLGTGFGIDNQTDEKSRQYATLPLDAAYICSVAYKRTITRIKKIHLSDFAVFHQ